MAPKNPAVALAAPTDVDVELPLNEFARDVDLELLGDVGLVEGAAAVLTDLGQAGSHEPPQSVLGWAAGGGPWGGSHGRACAWASWAGRRDTSWRRERPALAGAGRL